MNDPTQPAIQDPSDESTNGMALAAMITGIVGLILAFIPFVGILAWIVCPVAAILGFIALGKSTGKGMAITGIVSGILGILVCIAWIAALGAIGSAVGNFADENDIDTEAILEELEKQETT